MDEFKFTDENVQRIEAEFEKYPKKLPVVMKALYVGQEQNGWVSSGVVREVAKILEISEEQVLGVATFYTMYHKKPAGKNHLMVCTNVSCMLRGAYEIFEAIKDKLGIENGETTEDGLFSLEEAECMGSCGTAPMMAVNDEFIENLTKEKALEIIEELSKK